MSRGRVRESWSVSVTFVLVYVDEQPRACCRVLSAGLSPAWGGLCPVV